MKKFGFFLLHWVKHFLDTKCISRITITDETSIDIKWGRLSTKYYLAGNRDKTTDNPI